MAKEFDNRWIDSIKFNSNQTSRFRKARSSFMATNWIKKIIMEKLPCSEIGLTYCSSIIVVIRSKSFTVSWSLHSSTRFSAFELQNLVQKYIIYIKITLSTRYQYKYYYTSGSFFAITFTTPIIYYQKRDFIKAQLLS